MQNASYLFIFFVFNMLIFYPYPIYVVSQYCENNCKFTILSTTKLQNNYRHWACVAV